MQAPELRELEAAVARVTLRLDAKQTARAAAVRAARAVVESAEDAIAAAWGGDHVRAEKCVSVARHALRSAESMVAAYPDVLFASPCPVLEGGSQPGRDRPEDVLLEGVRLAGSEAEELRVADAQQAYARAAITCALLSGAPVPGPEQVDVPDGAWIVGLSLSSRDLAGHAEREQAAGDASSAPRQERVVVWQRWAREMDSASRRLSCPPTAPLAAR